MDTETREMLNHIFHKAKARPKGRLYIYESLKREIQMLNLPSDEYQDACIQLTRILRV